MKNTLIENILLWIAIITGVWGLFLFSFCKGIEKGQASMVNELCQKQVYDFCQPKTQTFELEE